MAQETTTEQTTNKPAENGEDRSIGENIRELTEASKQLLDAGKKMSDNLSELTDRVEHAKNLGSDLIKSPWLIVAASVIAGSILVAISRRN